MRILKLSFEITMIMHEQTFQQYQYIFGIGWRPSDAKLKV